MKPPSLPQLLLLAPTTRRIFFASAAFASPAGRRPPPPLPTCHPRARGRVLPSAFFRRKKRSCFPPPSAASSVTSVVRGGGGGGGGGAWEVGGPTSVFASSSSSFSASSVSDEGVSSAARSSLSIASPLTRRSSFGSLSYVDTRPLVQAGPNKIHRVLFVLGGPGAGKGTQCAKLVSEYKCVHLSVGELLRNERANPTGPDAELIEECLVAGKIVPVEISLRLLRAAMDKSDDQPADVESGGRYGSKVFLVDGFPRNFDNLSGWMDAMPAKDHDGTAAAAEGGSTSSSSSAAATLGALVYDCPIAELERRILSRAETSGRSDDNLSSARKRFETFQRETQPVVEALEEVQRIQAESLRGKGLTVVSHVAGDRTEEEVWEETKKAMDEYVRNDVLTRNAMLIERADVGDAEGYAELCDDDLLVGREEDEKGGKGENDDEGRKRKREERLRAAFDEHEVVQGTSSSSIAGRKRRSVIQNASIAFHGGTRAVVSYDRSIYRDDGVGDAPMTSFRETRVWAHGERGWLCVHFYRTPL